MKLTEKKSEKISGSFVINIPITYVFSFHSNKKKNPLTFDLDDPYDSRFFFILSKQQRKPLISDQPKEKQSSSLNE